MVRLWLALAFVVALGLPVLAKPAPASAANCGFALGFKTLHDLIPNTVGDCLVDEHHNPANGDGLQETAGPTGAGGLLVWRKADNWTAYTDGNQTWINGPLGLQARLNTALFPWESVPIKPAPAPAPTPTPMPVVVAPPARPPSPNVVTSGLYRVNLTMLEDDFYQDVSGVLFETSGCSEYTYGDSAIFNAGSMEIYFSSTTCSVSEVAAQYLESRIDGDFDGYEADRVYLLANGQVWQQVNAHYHYHYAYRPQVYIYSTSSGWNLRVMGSDGAVRVRRLA